MSTRSTQVASMDGDIRREQLNTVIHEVLHLVMNITLAW